MEASQKTRQNPSPTPEIEKNWRRIRPYWHIGTTILLSLIGMAVAGIIWVNNVNALPAKIDALDKRMGVVEGQVGKIDVVNQRVNDIADFMGVPRHKKNHDVEAN